MERSDKEVKEYDYLAKYYDFLLGDEEAFDYWLNYVEEEPFKTCLELASGSGVMAKILKEKGYDIIASDISLILEIRLSLSWPISSKKCIMESIFP